MGPPVADTTPFNPRSALAAGHPPSADETEIPRSAGGWRLLRVTAWFGLMAIGVAAVVPMLGFAWQNVTTWSLVNGGPESARAALASDWTTSTAPDYLETMAELSLSQPVADEATAFVAARRATQLDPSRAFAWAILAYLETRRTNGTVNELALDALTKSMDACPLCDQDLIRWRFNYVLAHWEQMPEPIRKRAFEHADLLRWIGPNAEFLAEMRYKARLKDVPFDAYRSAVKTPARTWDISPSIGLRAARQSPA
jgi:hypothetical protein